MTENANPKPFNISRQKCQRRKFVFINLSIKRYVYDPSNWLNRIQIKNYQKC